MFVLLMIIMMTMKLLLCSMVMDIGVILIFPTVNFAKNKP